MKKLLAILLAVSTLFCVSCGDKKDSSPDSTPSGDGNSDRLLSVQEILETSSASRLKADKYSLNKYVTPYWQSQIIYNETVVFYEEDGVVLDKKLMYKPAKILEVRNYGLDKLYVEGTDYEMTAEGIKFKEGSAIPTTNFDFFYLDQPLDPNAAFKSIKYPDKFVAYNEFTRFTDKTVCVTYIRTEEYGGPEQKYDGKLSVLTQKLKNTEDLTFLFYGDSIMEGCNASDHRNNAPYMPKFSELVVKKLKSYYGYNGETDIVHHNTAVGGWLSSTGVERWDSRNTNIVPDCFILNFGCNDGTFSASAESVLNNHRIMINKVLKLNPDCAIILISPIIPNTDATTSISEATVRNFANNQAEYESVYCDLAEEYENATTIKMTSMYNWLLERKEFIDVMASNISHPNDYLARVYAQAILTQLIDGKF